MEPMPSRLRLGHCLEGYNHNGNEYDPECSHCVTYTGFRLEEDPAVPDSVFVIFYDPEPSSSVRSAKAELSGFRFGKKYQIEEMPRYSELISKALYAQPPNQV